MIQVREKDLEAAPYTSWYVSVRDAAPEPQQKSS